MSKQNTPDGPSPKIYDTEKIIDIHSSESDPTLDSKKVREINSHMSPSKYSKTSTDEKHSDLTSGLPTLAKFSDSDKNKDVDIYDYRGKLK